MAEDNLVIFKQIDVASDEYQRECRLRQEILRAPLGLDLYAEDLHAEKTHWHFGLFDQQGALLACVIAVPLSATTVKIRQMAVAPGSQQRGYGRRSMQELERTLATRGFSHFVLHARRTAVEFYAKLGYAVVGEEFVEVTLPHYAMEKHIEA